MNVGAIHLLSGTFLLSAVVAGTLLVRGTGRWRSWLLFVLALSLMSLRSFALAAPYVLGEHLPAGDAASAVLSLVVAGLMLLGIAVVSSQFQRLARAQARVEKSLEASVADADRFRTIFESMPDGAFLHDLDGRLLEGNARALELIGYAAEDVLGRNLLDIGVLVEDQRQRAYLSMQSVPDEGAREYTIRRKDGVTLPVEVRSFPLTLAGKPQVLVAARDITERKKAEELIMSLGRLVDESVNEVYVMDFGTLRFVRVNQGACRNLGYRAEEFETLSPEEIVPALHREQFLEDLEPLLSRRVSRLQVRAMHRRKDGSTYPVQAHIQRSELFGREVIEIFAVDLTEQEEVYAELRRSEDRLREAQRVGRLGSWLWDVPSGTLEWSDEVYNVTGVDRENFDGQLSTWLGFMPPEDREVVLARATNLVENGGRLSVDHRLVLPSGEVRHMSETGEISVSVEGQAVKVLGTIIDITRRKQAEEALQELNQQLEDRVIERTAELESAVTELESFSYSVSHDLRQPLRSVDAYVRMMEEDAPGSFDEKTRGYYERVLTTVARMSEMIDALLLLSRIGRTELVVESVDLSAMVSTMLSDLAESGGSRKVQLDIPDGVCGQADSRLLDLLLRNLTSNAWKFSSGAEVTRIGLTVSVDRRDPVYCLRDNGAGFSMEFKDKLFGAFQRLHRQDEFPGTGVGLATAERIVRRHGGRIWAESAPGEGAAFFFTLGPSNRT